MPTYEMFWDCRLCGTEKLLGKTHRHCPNCGSPQEPDQRYFPPEEEKVAVEDHEFVGADCACSRCETPQSADATYCTNCGADMSDATAVGAKGEVDAGAQSGTRKPPPTPPPEEEEGGSGAAAAGAGLGLGCTALIALVVVAITAVCCLSIFWRSDAELVVTGHRWERTIAIEKLEMADKDDWCDKMPSDARNVRKSKKKRSTKKVADGQTCKTVNVDQGDGTFKTKEKCTKKFREEAVMGQWCRYEVESWEAQRKAKADGTGLDSTPKWPDAKVDGCKTLGCTRQGKRVESYIVEFAEPDGTKQTCDFSEKKWRTFAKGSSWKASKSVIANSIQCSGLSQ